MGKKTYTVISIIAGMVSLFGLLSFIEGTRPVNIGAFIFPMLISLGTFIASKK